MPFLPLTLSVKDSHIETSALVDSGSTVNVLPYDTGLRLGLVWEDQKIALPSLVGTLRGLPAFGVLITGEVSPFFPVPLAFAWTQSNDVPVILGQTNFFSEFDVYFFGSRKLFEVIPKNKQV
ncbi:hypothetical protein QUF70_11070 [Desulfobacterales bacterium HSG17]|nr:hypothetical protein [Desulfobacterales bacterium HSG17]